MKRSEAIDLAINLVEQSDLTSEIKKDAIYQLKICKSRIPQIKWDDASIRAYCDRVYKKEGILRCTDFNHAGQPYRKAILLAFGMTFTEFRDLYYPAKTGISSRSPYVEKTKEEWGEIFVSEYHRIKPNSMEEYNAKRDKKIPSWVTLANMYGLTKWSELLDQFGLSKQEVQYENIEVVRKSELLDKIAELRKKVYE